MRTLFLWGCLLLTLGCIYQSSFASESSEEQTCIDAHLAQLYPSDWHMLEDIFITQPEAKVDGLGRKALMAAIAAAAGTGAYFLSKKGLDAINQQDWFGARPYPYLDRKRHHITIGASITSGALTYLALRSHLLAIEERKQLACLMDNWETAKEFLPKKLTAGLAKLAQQYQQKGPQYSQNSDEALRLIKNAIYAHFPRTYSKKKWYDIFSEKRFYVYTYLNIDLIEMAGKALSFAKNLIM